MRVFITGAIGFVGVWLQRELAAAGHEVVAAPGPETLDITDRAGLVRWFSVPGGQPDAVVHLAGMAFAQDARSDPVEAFRVNVAGTIAVFEALREVGLRTPVLVSGSSEVYGAPKPEDLPLRETTPLDPRRPYALSKAAQEAVAVEAGVRWGFPVVVTRSFNHCGPGQRPVFVVPAMARRVLAVQRGAPGVIPAGNVDVKRDFSDVRDVAHAYRLLLEAAATGRLASEPQIVNVASGRAVSIRSLIESLCDLAHIHVSVQIDQSLVRTDDPPEIRGDPTRLIELTGWHAEIPFERTLADVFDDIQSPSGVERPT